MKRIDWTGVQQGNLKVLGFSHEEGDRIYWRCLCTCGREKLIQSRNLRSTKSCGCLVKELTGALNRSHGASTTVEYGVWWGMVSRCHSTSDSSYTRYGGRGISVCPHWRNSFSNFLADMGLRPSSKHTLERMDNDADYSPENCTWIPRADQAFNRRTSLRIVIEGRSKCLGEWIRLGGLGRSQALRARYLIAIRGTDPLTALNTVARESSIEVDWRNV